MIRRSCPELGEPEMRRRKRDGWKLLGRLKAHTWGGGGEVLTKYGDWGRDMLRRERDREILYVFSFDFGWSDPILSAHSEAKTQIDGLGKSVLSD